MPSRFGRLKDKGLAQVRAAMEQVETRALADAEKKGAQRQGRKERRKALNALAKKQRVSLRFPGRTAQIANALADDEEVDQLFGDSGGSLYALSDRRLLAADGLSSRVTSVDYSAISQVDSRWTQVKIKGPGVDLTLTGVDRRQELVSELQRRRAMGRGTPAATGSPAQAPQPVGSVADELKKLGELRDSGLLTDEEFQAQKAKLLASY